MNVVFYSIVEIKGLFMEDDSHHKTQDDNDNILFHI